MNKSTIPNFEFRLHEKLKEREQDNSVRSLSTYSGLIDFTSNDYLGLAHSPELHSLIQDTILKLPKLNGATGSRLLSGNNVYTEQVEASLAKIFDGESALIFNSGYAANQGILSSIPQRGDTILYDELAHACIRDGARLSHATRLPFRHSDLNDLELKLKKAQGQIYIAVESIYSMDGDQCPLPELVILAEKYNAVVLLDEAHGTGVLGHQGSGLACLIGVHKKIPVRVYTFGKAMGTHGACVVGSKSVIDFLINFARPFIFSTAMPLHSIASIATSFQFLTENIKLQQILKDRINTYINEANASSLKSIPSQSQIQGIIIPGNDRVKNIANQLRSSGFDARPILSPTVPKGSERIRICLHIYNTDDQIKQLIQQLVRL